MSWFRKQAATAVQEAVQTPKKNSPTPPVAVPIDVELTGEEAKEYERITTKLGITAQRSLLLLALKELEIPLFPYRDVRSYLDKLFGGDPDYKWSWRPLRAEDYSRTGLPNWEQARNAMNGGWKFDNLYNQPLPYPVLRTMERIQERLPNAGFFVSDARYADDVKDPFLAVSLPGLNEMLVVEVWDEPGFKR